MFKQIHACISLLKCIKNKPMVMAMAMMMLIPGASYLKASPIAGNETETALQPITVTGKVVDQDGIGLPGVYVVLQGTNTGVVTDANGSYSIQVPGQDAVLEFSYIGFLKETVAVAGKSVIDVTLMADVTALEEVVVIGYGTQRKESVTGSVASVNADVIQDVPAANITQSLQGRVSGVEMSQTSTKPGASMQIRIRGVRSVNASNDPLVVLDGIPFAGNIGDINPNDIKSIDILKDASATAIYGSRGANGVILVTTNKGTKGQKAQINYNGYYGVRKVFAPYPMMNAAEFSALRDAAGIYENDGLDEDRSVDTDWQDLFYRNGSVNSHNLSISGGTEKGAYSFSAGYLKDEAVIPTQGYERLSIRGALDQEVGDYFKFGFSTNNNYSTNTGNQVGIYGVLSMSPIVNPYNADGSLKRVVHMPLDDQFVWTKDVIEGLEDQYLSETRAYATYNNLYGEVKIPGVEGLKYRLNLGLDFRQSNSGSYTGQGIGSVNEETESTASIGNSHNYHWVAENLLTYDRLFAGKHQVNVVALYSAEQTKYNSSSISAKDIPSDDFQFYNLGNARGEITINPAYQTYQLRGLLSWMGRFMYAYDNRYMFSAAVRSDGSSVLAEGEKWHTYPAVSLGWNIGNESFMQNITAINALKLRAGYGQTSNQAIDPYKTFGLLGTRDYNFGSEFTTGYLVSELPNLNLGWEYSSTWNYGVDFGLFNDRLSGTIEYYITNTKDILLPITLPATNGVTTMMANVGEMQNKGVEVSLNGVIIENANGLTWEAGINFYTNKNELTKLASGEDKNEANWWFVGHPINVIYDYEKIGLWQEEDQYRDILEPGGNVGMIKVKYAGDYNDDGTPVRRIGTDDRQIIEIDPKFQGGFNTRLAYKGFDLNIVGAYRHGGKLISTLYSSTGYLNLMTGRRGNVKVDYWTPENTDADYPNPAGILSGDNPKYGTTLGYFDAGYMKIRTITLGYALNQKLISKAGIDKLRIYVQAQNPFVLFSPYYKESGMDPESNSYGDENAATTGTYPRRLLTIGTNTPSTRNFLIGINLTF